MSIKPSMLCLSSLLVYSCASRIFPAATPMEDSSISKPADFSRLAPAKDAIDPKFETYWKNSATAEAAEIEATSELVRRFIAERARLQESWKPEYDALLARRNSGVQLSKAESKRFETLQNVFQELPIKGGFATRDVNRRGQGCFAADVVFYDDMPLDFQKGYFKPGARYDAVLRFSNSNHRNQHDFVADARAVAVKLLQNGTLPTSSGSPRKSLPQGIEEAARLNTIGLLDFNAINFPVYFSSDPVNYRKINEGFLAQSKDPGFGLPYRLGELKAVYFSGSDPWHRELTRRVHGSLVKNLLTESYFGMMAFRLGEAEDPSRIAYKFKWEPCPSNPGMGSQPAWTKKRVYADPFNDWKDSIPQATLDELSTPEEFYYLRKNLFADLAASDNVCFELKLQRFLDEKNTPVEDVTRPWLESDEQRAEWAETYANNVRFIPFGESKRADRRREILGTSLSPAIAIARMTISPAEPDLAASVRNGASGNTALCEALSFNPWNNVPSAHKPLGIMGRMRKGVYAASRDTRQSLNKVKPMIDSGR